MTERLNRAAADLTEAAAIHDLAVRKLRDQIRGQPGSGLAGGGSRTLASPVETALGLNDSNPGRDHTYRLTADRPAVVLEMIDKLTARIAKDTAILVRLLASEIPHAPTPKDQREVERLNDPAVAGECELTRKHLGCHEPAHTANPTDVGGILTTPKMLSRWVYDFVRTTGREPTASELDRHHRGLKVTVKA